MQIVELLDGLRREEGLSHKEFAEKLGLSPAFWSQVMSGKRELGLESVRKITVKYPQLTFAFLPMQKGGFDDGSSKTTESATTQT